MAIRKSWIYLLTQLPQGDTVVLTTSAWTATVHASNFILWFGCNVFTWCLLRCFLPRFPNSVWYKISLRLVGLFGNNDLVLLSYSFPFLSEIQYRIRGKERHQPLISSLSFSSSLSCMQRILLPFFLWRNLCNNFLCDNLLFLRITFTFCNNFLFLSFFLGIIYVYPCTHFPW